MKDHAGMLFVIFLILIVITAVAHIAIGKSPRTRGQIAELLLVYLIAGYYGVCMTYGAYIHLRYGEEIARYKGWPAGPMQTLYAFALLGLAAAAIPVIWYRGVYLQAPALCGAILSFGGAWVHISEMRKRRAFLPLRDGPEIVLDVGVPLAVIVLLVLYRTSGRATHQ